MLRNHAMTPFCIDTPFTTHRINGVDVCRSAIDLVASAYVLPHHSALILRFRGCALGQNAASHALFHPPPFFSISFCPLSSLWDSIWAARLFSCDEPCCSCQRVRVQPDRLAPPPLPLALADALAPLGPAPLLVIPNACAVHVLPLRR